MRDFCFKQVTSPAELHGAFSVRHKVFIIEQGIAREEEWDGLDDECLQFIASSNEKIVGTARVRFPSHEYAKIERMAVLQDFRRQGIGAGILTCIERELRNQCVNETVLHAQMTAVPFYKSCGFITVGTPFNEAGIEHIKMQKWLIP